MSIFPRHLAHAFHGGAGAILSFLFCIALFSSAAKGAGEAPLKQRSALYTPETLTNVLENLAKHPRGEQFKKEAIKTAAFWKNLSDDELWDIMFGPKITRSWMVWSNGECPSCRKGVPMYTWGMDGKEHPWKVRCPHCAEMFPKNDFKAFYRSGLDEHGVFDPKRADRKLLFNTDHTDPNDPLHQFGVDDGEGYVEGTKRWRFIGAYLIYGHFKQLVVGGINALATAYIFTGDPIYAHKAGILIDRVADLYPSFDYSTQGLVYEYKALRGYVSTWHDACEETISIVLGYDRVFEGLRDDKELVTFLSRKAAEYKLANPKSSFADIQRNIENNILRDVLKNRPKIESNFPRTDCAIAATKTVLGWPENRTEVEAFIDTFVRRATAVDGVTGEKGLSSYSSYTISGMASFLAEYSRLEPDFLSKMIQRVPSLRDAYRFHIDMFCLDRYYPDSGDSGSFGKPANRYLGASFQKLTGASVAPSLFSFFWQLYEATGDIAYVQTLYRANGRSLDGLPHDIFLDEPDRVRAGVANIVNKHGSDVKLGSVNKQVWRIGILRSGEKENARALVLDYDAGGAHSHHDGMTISLFANGLSLLPEFGYPPVQFGGWETRKAKWYLDTAAHNTVVVDGRNHRNAGGQTTLWADGRQIRAMRASAPQLIGGTRFERTLVMVDVSTNQFYVVDVFRVVGGADHAKFVHGPAGDLQTTGVKLEQAPDYGFGSQMRNFRHDVEPASGWTATWNITDLYSVLPEGKRVSFRYTDLSNGVRAHTAEAWVAPYFNSFAREMWTPSLMIRKQGAAPLATTFVSVMEPFEQQSAIKAMRRLALSDVAGKPLPDSDVAIEIEFQSGDRDLIVVADPDRVKTNAPSKQVDWDVGMEGELAWVRRDKKGRVSQMALCAGNRLHARKSAIESAPPAELAEADFTTFKPRLVSGNAEQVKLKK